MKSRDDVPAVTAAEENVGQRYVAEVRRENAANAVYPASVIPYQFMLNAIYTNR